MGNKSTKINKNDLKRKNKNNFEEDNKIVDIPKSKIIENEKEIILDDEEKEIPDMKNHELDEIEEIVKPHYRDEDDLNEEENDIPEKKFTEKVGEIMNFHSNLATNILLTVGCTLGNKYAINKTGEKIGNFLNPNQQNIKNNIQNVKQSNNDNSSFSSDSEQEVENPFSILDFLPKNAFNKNTSIPKNKKCCLCKENFNLGTTLSILPCGDYYHYSCLYKFLKNDSNKVCPCCNVEITMKFLREKSI